MENQKTFDLLDIFIYLWKKKIPIIIVTVAGAIISIIVSLMMTDYFKAETVLFPTTFISPATSAVRHANQETDPLIIGDEDDLERMIQLLKSDYISEKIITEFDLIKHYKISPDDPHLKTKVKKTYEGNVSFSKTPYQGVIISVVDIDPVLGADIANRIAVLFDVLVSDMQKQRSLEAYNTVKNSYKKELEYLHMLEDSLDIYRQYGILDYKSEVDRYSEAYGKAYGKNTLTNKGKRFFKEKFAILKKYGKQFYSLVEFIDMEREKVTSLHHTKIVMEQNIKQPMTHKYVISYAQPSDKKAFPKRMFIVIFSTFGAFMFAVALILFLDFIKEFINRIKKEKQ